MARKTKKLEKTKKKTKKLKKPETTITNASLVVLAGFHNPSILNPDFLKSQDIVPSDWKINESITSMTLSQVRFKNNITITLEPSRLRVSTDTLSNFHEEFPIYDIGARYIEELPHVNYTSIGINWKVAVPKSKPDSWIAKKFLNTGAWRDQKPRIAGVVITLQMYDRNIRTAFKIAGAKFAFPGRVPFMGIEVDTNAHHEGPFDGVTEITKLINNWPRRRQFVLDQTKRLMGRI